MKEEGKFELAIHVLALPALRLDRIEVVVEFGKALRVYLLLVGIGCEEVGVDFAEELP